MEKKIPINLRVGKVLIEALRDCRETIIDGTLAQQRPDGEPTRTAAREWHRIIKVIDKALEQAESN